ncbi:hypothetical protein [Desulfotalea psychrophila]|nr:hypothetical protein [Desulfotalea psychrophila]
MFERSHLKLSWGLRRTAEGRSGRAPFFRRKPYYRRMIKPYYWFAFE